jgi:hypothetical protein
MGKRRFTGGDGLEGFAKYLHKVLMLNELGGGIGGYELADAETGKSGYSFGGNQMDLAKNSSARDVLRDILLINKMSKEQIKVYLDQFGKNKKFEPFSTSPDVGLIDAALGSVEGVKIIDSVYLREINANVARVDAVLKKVDERIKPYVYDPVVRLVLADYHNQLRLDINGKMDLLLQGKPVTFKTKADLDLAKVKSPDDLVKLIRAAIYATEWGSKPEGKKDIFRRQGNIDKVVAEFITPQRDKLKEVARQESQKTVKVEPKEKFPEPRKSPHPSSQSDEKKSDHQPQHKEGAHTEHNEHKRDPHKAHHNEHSKLLGFHARRLQIMEQQIERKSSDAERKIPSGGSAKIEKEPREEVHESVCSGPRF